MPTETLKLNGSVLVEPDPDRVFGVLARSLMAAAKSAVSQRGVFHLALSGGGTPAPFYRRLVTDPQYREIPWEKTHLWIVDERRVPEDDERSNVKMIRETLGDHVPLSDGHLHPVPVLSEDPGAEYQARLAEVFGLNLSDEGQPAPPPRLEFVLLGIGDDGHTASLFPHSPGLTITDRWVINNDGPNVTPPPRVTMTFSLLNSARQLAVLVCGDKKAATIRRIDQQLQDSGPDIQNLPITGIHPTDGTLIWYLDAAAAGTS